VSTWGGAVHWSPTFSQTFRSGGVHFRGYFRDESSDGQYCDEDLATQLCVLFQGFRVYDFGCGTGEYVRRMRGAGIDAAGFDGNPTLFPDVTSNFDLTTPVTLTCAADFLLSLEVGEHIPMQFANCYIDNVCNHAKIGVVLSWAVPGQGGRGHFNEQPNEWVIAQLSKRGWIYDSVAAMKLRSICRLPWFKNTLMVFRPEHVEPARRFS
jgi:SAM-dependent methyltransferase